MQFDGQVVEKIQMVKYGSRLLEQLDRKLRLIYTKIKILRKDTEIDTEIEFDIL